jgi:NRPS condensation-like uncharacterized protein
MWSLTPFEQYMVDDDSVDFPMNFTAVWSCEGSVDLDRLQQSLDDVLRNHPLLTSRLENAMWVSSNNRVVIQQMDCCRDESKKVELASGRVVPLKVQLVRCSSGCSEIHMTFHHASCDGIGAMEFCGDVFREYAKACSGSTGHQNIPKRKKVGASTLLGSRGVLERPVVEGVSWLDAMRFFLGEARWFFLDRATAIPCDGVVLDDTSKNELPTIQLTRGETNQLRRYAEIHGASLNELLMALLTGVIGNFCKAPGQSRKSWVGMVQPVNMRPRLSQRMPAANGIGYAFYRRRIDECRCWEDLLPKLIDDSRAVVKYGLAGCFHDALAILQKIPSPLRQWFVRSMKPGTFVFSYLGDPRRRFAHSLAGEQESIDVGDFKIVNFSVAPPPRNGTEVAILASLFGQRLTLWMRPSQRLSGTVSMKKLRMLVEAAVRDCICSTAEAKVRAQGLKSGGPKELVESG